MKSVGSLPYEIASGTLMFDPIVIQSWMSTHEEWVKNDYNEESRHYQYWRKHLAWLDPSVVPPSGWRNYYLKPQASNLNSNNTHLYILIHLFSFLRTRSPLHPEPLSVYCICLARERLHFRDSCVYQVSYPCIGVWYCLLRLARIYHKTSWLYPQAWSWYLPCGSSYPKKYFARVRWIL